MDRAVSAHAPAQDRGTESHTYRRVDVPVDDGTLHAGVWEPVGADEHTPTVLAIHGVTAQHLAFAELALLLPGVRVVAPDLRGRGRSNARPGPYGMPRHADDVAALAAHLGVRRAVVVGHSMGGFVSVVLAHRHRDLVSRLVLVDGGLPLDLPAGLDVETAMHAVLGPAVQRLSMTFPDLAAYRDFWKQHPAFTADWSSSIEAYFDNDVEPVPADGATEGGAVRAAARIEALTEDQKELFSGASILAGLDALTALDVPTLFLRAEAGIMAGPPLYAPEHLAQWAARLPTMRTVEITDVNHYTIVMTRHGARAVAAHVTDLLDDEGER